MRHIRRVDPKLLALDTLDDLNPCELPYLVLRAADPAPDVVETVAKMARDALDRARELIEQGTDLDADTIADAAYIGFIVPDQFMSLCGLVSEPALHDASVAGETLRRALR